MTIYLIRHTTPLVAEGTCYGQTDVPLKDTFEKEVENLRNRLRIGGDVIARVVTSPLNRCTTLAATLWPDKEAERVNALRELHFGAWENRAWSDLQGPDLERWMSNFVDGRVPGGESYRDLYERCSAWWNEQVFDTPTAIVTHAGPIRSLLCHVLQTPLDEAFSNYQVPYGAAWRLVEENGSRTARLL